VILWIQRRRDDSLHSFLMLRGFNNSKKILRIGIFFWIFDILQLSVEMKKSFNGLQLAFIKWWRILKGKLPCLKLNFEFPLEEKLLDCNISYDWSFVNREKKVKTRKTRLKTKFWQTESFTLNCFFDKFCSFPLEFATIKLK
jgi:hypothetical protein